LRLAVIMSGGKGKRFWPLSRARRAKQFIKLMSGKTLLELTIERLIPVFTEDQILVVTQEIQLEQTKEILSRWEGIRVLAEPIGKNTAPCIAFATTYALHSHGDCVLIFLPADHFIAEVDAFRDILMASAEFANRFDKIVTIGITPDRPSTGYGYIAMGELIDQVGGRQFFGVDRFTEKPNIDIAKGYLKSGRYLWNAGIFCAKASVMLSELRQHLPKVASAFEQCQQSYGTHLEPAQLRECYSGVEEISIDYAIMEKTDRACVTPAEIGWDDVGSWESFSKYLESDQDQNRVRGSHIGIESQDCIIYSDRQVVATLGLKGLAIIVTDDVILVADRRKGEEVRRIVDLIETKGFSELL